LPITKHLKLGRVEYELAKEERRAPRSPSR